MKRRVAAELERQLLQRVGAAARQVLADRRRAGEADLAHARIVEPDVDHLRRARSREAVTMFSTPGGTPASSASLTSASEVSGVSSAGLQTTVQPAASAGRDLARDHRGREVPRRDRGDHAHRLLQREHAPAGAPARG